METNHKAQNGRLTKYDKPPQVAKEIPKSAKEIMNQKTNEWVVKSDG